MGRTLDYSKNFSHLNGTSAGLRHFSKFLVLSTLFLILAGSLITTYGAGLSVPDWPNSYGHFMFSFPLADMVGGIFYEHGHRLIASTVGFMTVLMAIWVVFKENRKWVKKLSLLALSAVILQGLLGGITVLFFLPTAISVSHAILGQTFFVITIILAYSLSRERRLRELQEQKTTVQLVPYALGLTALIYLQLFLGALMRHTGSGLAIPDFPTMAGAWWPAMNESMLININAWRFYQHLDPVELSQVWMHLAHRLGAILVVVGAGVLFKKVWAFRQTHKLIYGSVLAITGLLLVQVTLGVFTVLSVKQLWITSFHVMTGAALLGFSVLISLRCLPLSLAECRNLFKKNKE